MFALLLAIYSLGLVAIYAIVCLSHGGTNPFKRVLTTREYPILRALFIGVSVIWLSPVVALLGWQVSQGDPTACTLLALIGLPFVIAVVVHARQRWLAPPA